VIKIQQRRIDEKQQQLQQTLGLFATTARLQVMYDVCSTYLTSLIVVQVLRGVTTRRRLTRDPLTRSTVDMTAM